MKIKLSYNGRTYTGTWDVTATEYQDRAHLTIERGAEEKKVYFNDRDELRRFNEGVQLCRCKDEDGKEVFIGGFNKSK